MWQGLESITGYKGRSWRKIIGSHITPDELNEFYASFEALNTEPLGREVARRSKLNPPITISSVDVAKYTPGRQPTQTTFLDKHSKSADRC